MFAKVAHDLQEPLLRRRSRQAPGRNTAEQPLAREPQNGVVLGARPGEITPFDFLARTFIFSLRRAAPQPGQDYIYGQVGDASRAEERLRFGLAFGTQR